MTSMEEGQGVPNFAQLLEEQVEREKKARQEKSEENKKQWLNRKQQKQREALAHRFLESQLRHKIGVWRYIAGSRLSVVLTAPVVYLGWIAFFVMDAFVTLFQSVCFPVYAIPKVKRLG